MKIKNTKKKTKAPQSLSSLINLIKTRTYNKNKKPFNYYNKIKLNKIINNILSPEEISYKDQNIFITDEQFMNRYYTYNESEIRLTNYIEFYQNLENYYQFNYEIYNQRRIMYKNQKRKYKLENRKVEKKKKTKKNKRKNMLGKLKNSTVYLDEVKSVNSGHFEFNKWENNSENFELNLPGYNHSGSLHDIFEPVFSSTHSFLSENEIEKKKSVSDFCLGSMNEDNSSIDSIIAEISKLDNIEESQIRKNSVEASQMDMGVFNLFPDLNREYEKNNFDFTNFKKDLDFQNNPELVRNINLKKAFHIKEENFEIFQLEGGNNKKTKNFERRRVMKMKKNSIKNNSLVDKNTLESKFSTDNKIKVKKERKLEKKSKMNFINKKLKKNKNTLINKKQQVLKRKIKEKILRPKFFVTSHFDKSNSKLSNKSKKSDNNSIKLQSKKSLKNNIKKSKFRRNDYDYEFVEKKLFCHKKDANRKNSMNQKNLILNSKKISFQDLTRNLSNQKLNQSLSKKFFNKNKKHNQTRKKSKIKQKNYRKKDFINKKKEKSPRNSRLGNNRSRSLKREYDEYDYYKQKSDLKEFRKKKNKSSDRKLIKKNHVFVKQRISLQNLKGKEKDFVKLIPKKAKIMY